jgi:CheY-like chemotaxis protein
MSDTSLFSKLAEPAFRIRILYGLTLVAGAVVLALPPGVLVDLDAMAADKAAHYEGGRLIATGTFVMLYFALSTFLLLFSKAPVTLRLLYLPTAFALAGGIAMALVFLVAGGKEAIDATGAGTVDWHDFTATLDGGYLPNIEALLLLLGFTPALIPIDMLLQWPARAGGEKGTGHTDVDTYLQEKKTLSSRKAEVLIVEDDLACANLALKFCKKIGKRCIHEDTIAAADKSFNDLKGQLQLILLDLFVRVESNGDRRTGAEWLAEISKTYPKGNRNFLVIITTGHPEQLGEQADLADRVLPKPWSPKELQAFLVENALIES